LRIINIGFLQHCKFSCLENQQSSDISISWAWWNSSRACTFPDICFHSEQDRTQLDGLGATLPWPVLVFLIGNFFSNVRTFNFIIMITALKKLGIFKCIHGIGWWTNPWAGDNKQTNKLDLVLTIMEPNLILYRFSESLAIVTHQKARWNFIGCFLFIYFFYSYRPQTCFLKRKILIIFEHQAFSPPPT
jgi:hypothetical protein